MLKKFNDSKKYEKYKNIIFDLCKAYYSYQKNNEEKNENDYDNYFFSKRDFYSLIKSTMIDIIEYENNKFLKNDS